MNNTNAPPLQKLVSVIKADAKEIIMKRHLETLIAGILITALGAFLIKNDPPNIIWFAVLLYGLYLLLRNL